VDEVYGGMAEHVYVCVCVCVALNYVLAKGDIMER